MTDAEILGEFARCVDGLLMPSESDFPLLPFVWEGKDVGPELDDAALRRHLGLASEVGIERPDPQAYFDGLSVVDAEMDPAQVKRAHRFQELKKMLDASVRGLLVIRVGRVRLDVYMVGRTPSGNWAGLSSVQVET